jgi:thiol-disulfide isomerase/thioredoxin
VIFAVALTVAGCGSVAHDSAPSAAQLRTDLKASPPLLAALHRQGNQLLGGGKPAFEARLHALRGYPVVVTQWSSTCEPCQVEFPYFQQLSAELGSRVAFIGVDASDDSSGGAKSWLRRFPVSFPSYRDADMGIALALSVPFANDTPVTYFYTADRYGVVSRRLLHERAQPAPRDQSRPRCLRSASTRSRACARSSPPTGPAAREQGDPFAEGNEAQTPPELYAVRPGGRRADTPGWLVRVFPNRYPALAGEPPALARDAKARTSSRRWPAAARTR